MDDAGGTLATVSSVVTVLAAELTDGRMLVTQTAPIRLPLPGPLNQSVESRASSSLPGCTAKGLRVLAEPVRRTLTNGWAVHGPPVN